MKKILKIAGFSVLSVGFLNHSYANTTTLSALRTTDLYKICCARLLYSQSKIRK